jgi:uncharacterized protein YdcH (DUF465 family)
MSENLVNIPQNDSYFPNLHPNRGILNDQIKNQKQNQENIKNIRQSF